MQFFKQLSACLAISVLLFSCKKDIDDSGAACETNQTTKVTFKNNSSAGLRVEMAKTFNADYLPVDALFTIDLAPGASVVKEFRADYYFIQWKNNCAVACTQRSFYAKDFAVCQVYEEAQ